MTISEFHERRIPKIRYGNSDAVLLTAQDFYNDFLHEGHRLPNLEMVIKWHDLLVKYINDPTSKTFLVRKYESRKDNGKWDNRRGAIVRFSDGFEVVYASNFLAHEIFMMAYSNFVPDYEDFKNSIENRTLPITSGTKVEKDIRSYLVSSNKTIDCYFAHIMDVNGEYLRNDPNKTYAALSIDEIDTMYPSGTAENWISSSDKIYHMGYQLDLESKNLIKAHFLRFLDPMNYFLTPQTKHCKHKVANFNKNIGEYEYLRYYIQELYANEFKEKYSEFSQLARFCAKVPKGYTGKEEIGLEYSLTFCNFSEKGAGSETSPRPKKDSIFDDFIAYMSSEKPKSTMSYCSSIRQVMGHLDYDDLDVLAERIDMAVEYCTKRIEEATLSNNTKQKKKFNNYRSAIKKYKEFLETNN